MRTLTVVAVVASSLLVGCGSADDQGATSTSSGSTGSAQTSGRTDDPGTADPAPATTVTVEEGPAECRPVGTGTGSTVSVTRGPVSCSKARSLARYFLSGDAPYADGGDHSQSWSELGGGWRGTMNMGAWEIWNPKTNARVAGRISQ